MRTMGSHSENATDTPASNTVPNTVPKQPASPTFLVACWLLALISFIQLIVIAAALTKEKRSVVTTQAVVAPRRATSIPATNPGSIRPRSIDEILASVDPHSSQVSLTTDKKPDISYDSSNESNIASELSDKINIAAPVTVVGSSDPILPPRYTSIIIADPVVEKLIAESRTLQLDGDMVRAMLKLAEAARLDPSEAAVIYNKGLLYEEMGLFTQAADQYQEVQQMGIAAGTFFKLSAKKLTKGMDAAHANRAALSIGPMNVRRDKETQGKQQVKLAITILARPDKSINPSDVSVQVHFYDKLDNGEITKASSRAIITEGQWDSNADWKGASHEETVSISYTIAEVDLAQAHLFGKRQYYGHVVELYYNNEVIDQQASPRRLNSIHGNHVSPQYNQSLPWLPGDQNTLLPGKDKFDYGDDSALPRR
jgi:tetratricopeptide (TPR) repeat protein